MGETMKATLIILAVLMAGIVLAAEAPEREASPMMLEIRAAFAATQVEVADLQARYKAAADPEQAREILREAALVKREGRIEIMRIQLRYARQNGDDARGAELEQIVTRMTTPPAKGVPVPRRDHE